MKHDPNCTGCHDCCDPEMRAALSAFTAGDYVTYCRWLTGQDAKNRLRSAGARGELRTNVHFQEDIMTDYTPIDPYAAGLAKIRAASATPESTFAERYAAERTREFAEMRASSTASPRVQPRRLTTAEAAQYTPPDPYRPALDKMRSEQR